MARPKKIDPNGLNEWLAKHPGWERTLEGSVSKPEGEKREALVRSFAFPDFAGALAFAVHLGMAAEKRDHHPDLLLQWGRARVLWTTHDGGGITELDLELAAVTEALAPASRQG